MKEMKKLEDHKEEIEAYLASLPRVTFNAKIHVKDEEKIESHDLLTYEFEFERHHKVRPLSHYSSKNSSLSDSLTKSKKYGTFCWARQKKD